MYYVYWLHLKEHTNPRIEGYIGITYNFYKRMRNHKKNRKTTHLYYAIKKYGWENIIKESIMSGLSKEEVFHYESILRPTNSIGWNSQKGGEIGVEKEWYLLEENKNKHSNATSKYTKLGIQKKDTIKARSDRAKQNWITNKESYKDIAKGSNNPRAILDEEDVHFIKYTLFPFGLSNKEISLYFNVKHYVISFIRTEKNWSYI